MPSPLNIIIHDLQSRTYTLTLGQIVDAIGKNGLRKAQGDFWVEDWDGNVIAACALGMAAINLSIRWADLRNALWDVRMYSHEGECDEMDCYCEESISVTDWIVEQNDTTGLSFKEIADALRQELGHRLNETITLTAQPITIKKVYNAVQD
jgi:hypothetical protein